MHKIMYSNNKMNNNNNKINNIGNKITDNFIKLLEDNDKEG